MEDLFKIHIKKMVNDVIKDLNFINEEKIFFNKLKEGLIKTYPIKNFEDYLYKWKNKNIEHEFYIDSERSLVEIKFLNYVSSDIIKYYISISQVYGYFPSSFRIYRKKGMTIEDNWSYIEFLNKQNKYNDTLASVVVRFESKFDEEIQTPKIIYHVTPSSNVEKILRIGLIPKNNKSTHPERIYFSTSLDDIKKLKTQFEYENYNVNYSILEIIPTNDIKLMKDPNINDNGVYCYCNITPKNIKLVK